MYYPLALPAGNKIAKHIEILRTDNVQFSSMGQASCKKIKLILSKHYSKVGVSIVNSVSDLERVVQMRPDLVFLGLKRLPSSHWQNQSINGDVWMSDYFDKAGIAYTGSAKAAIKLDFNKESAKIKVRSVGLKTADYFTAFPGEYSKAKSLPIKFPLFIKPRDIGGGKGIDENSVAHNFKEFERKVDSIFNELGSVSLVESYLSGREFSVAILEDAESSETMVMPIEIIAEKNIFGDRVLSAKVKAEDNELVIGIADQLISKNICKLAVDVYRLLGARDLARIDIRMDSKQRAHFLEANFMPGPGTRYFAGACEINRGIGYEKVILGITQLGLRRSRNLALI